MKEYLLKKNPDGSIVTVRDVQLVLLEMLKDIDRICRAHQIPYFLIGGSALGAVRHRGFIPWDDDMDIAMMREDYYRFLSILENECPAQYIYQCFEKDNRYNVLIPAMKFRKKGTYLKEVNRLLENRCTGYDGCDGVFIDIFVYDYANDNRWLDLPLRFLNTGLMAIEVFFDQVLHLNPVRTKRSILKIARWYGKHCESQGSKRVGLDLTWVWRNPFHPYIYDYDAIFPLQYVSFEDTEFPIAQDSHAYLCVEIAPSYMTLPSETLQKPKHVVDIKL